MYIKVTNGVVEKASYSIGQLRKDNPQTSFPKNPSIEFLEEWGVFPVRPTSGPMVNHTKNVKEGIPVKQGNEWVQVWEVVDATQEEIESRSKSMASIIRAERDQKLVESDWTQLPDAPVDSSAWAAYRQELRDISKQSNFPWNVVWPTTP